MSTKHTPGPWVFEADRGGEPTVNITNASGRSHVALVGVPESLRDKERDANARLIAAAPALLDALRGMLAQHSVSTNSGRPEPCDCDACDAARTAIALAEGERGA